MIERCRVSLGREAFDCEHLGDYHDLHRKTAVLLLADVVAWVRGLRGGGRGRRGLPVGRATHRAGGRHGPEVPLEPGEAIVDISPSAADTCKVKPEQFSRVRPYDAAACLLLLACHVLHWRLLPAAGA